MFLMSEMTLYSAAPTCTSSASLRWRADYFQNDMLSVRYEYQHPSSAKESLIA